MTADAADRRRRDLGRGHRGERLACWALRLKFYRILALRYRTRLGEIDIVARRGDLVAIVEVKARPSVVEAMDAVGPAAQRRIEAAADLWLARQKDHHRLSLRFDIVAVRPWRWPVHVPGAWAPRRL
ncbi:YraN family protein [Aurantimonas sp. HBX-1]|uniref:YraN family protein n=1 Tax=Aurantimonas sp. HBX-1 TaxID=2906072 RepID=UPI001F46A452|nr:YraN family protein [Aurantimonas sp. HBX-1]UIJ71528.1 YraN family protein [Aurantimonas sp. HBX-1]